MDDLVQAVIMTATVPGAVVGLLCSFRSGLLTTLLGVIVGALGGLGGGFALPAILGALNSTIPDGPITVVVGAIVGALILLLLTSGFRKPAAA